MNPSIKFLGLLLVAFELSFTTKISLNLVLIALAVIVLAWSRMSWRTWAWLWLLPAIPAFGSWMMIVRFTPGHDWHYAWVLVTRLYAFVFTGACFTRTISVVEFAQSLEQNLHLPAKFAYGVLAALNLVPRIHQEVNIMRAAGRMRGLTLSFWSPQLYFKAIMAALQWSQNLAAAMTSHGFVEDAPRTAWREIPLPAWNWWVLVIGVGLLQIGAFWNPFF